jgi:hypothetical protein
MGLGAYFKMYGGFYGDFLLSRREILLARMKEQTKRYK